MILLLGKNKDMELYLKNKLNMNISENMFYPSNMDHPTEFGKYIPIIKETNPEVIITHSLEMMDLLLESDLDFKVITVRNYNGEIKARILGKSETLENRNMFGFDPRH